MSEFIAITDSERVRRIVISRPAKKNALTVDMYTALNEALTTAAKDDAISVVTVGGAGDVFSAGNDIGDFMKAATGRVADDSPRPGGVLIQTLASFPKPLVAGVNGLAIGIGATMLLHCDLVIASSAATFQFPFTRLALVPEAGSSVLLPARVGLQRALEWMLLGERIGADEALRAGMINEVVAPDDLARTVTEKAGALAKLPLGALCETKRLVREPMRASVEQAILRELKAFAARLTTPEAAAAFQAFLTRR